MMHSRLLTVICIATCVLCVITVSAQSFCTRAGWVRAKMMSEHLQPISHSDTLAARVFERFFAIADPNGLYFTEADLQSLRQYQSTLDDDLASGKCKFLDDAKAIALINVARFQRFSDSVLSKPVGSGTGFLPTTARINQRATDKVTLANFWLTYIRREILSSNLRHLRSGMTSGPLAPASIESWEPTARANAKKRIDRMVDKLLSTPHALGDHLGESLLQAIPAAFDPHSKFFTPPEMALFNDALSTEEQSFGLELDEGTGGELMVYNMVPGGPAWRSNQINEGDVIVELTSVDGDKFDFANMDAEEGNSLLRSEKFSKAEITFRKSDGSFTKVQLAKARIRNDENVVFGLVLEGEKKIGYINLPSFFSSPKGQGGPGCAASVIQEIIKLKKENIEGLILDLRYNGGGNLYETIELIGAFIDVGPVAVLENPKSGAVTAKDLNRGVVYAGPLMVMVNGGSASASEMLAAALQDYRRATIVGMTTFGKATAQTIVPVHTSASAGHVKVTDDRLYRITGESLQQRGVVPDIEIPDRTAIHRRMESRLAYPIASTVTNKKVYYQPFSSRDYTEVRQKSQARIAQSERFRRLAERNDLLSKPIPFDYERFCELVNHLDQVVDQPIDTKQYKVSNAKLNQAVLDADTYHAELNQKFVNDIMQSYQVEEAYMIMLDLLNQKE